MFSPNRLTAYASILNLCISIQLERRLAAHSHFGVTHTSKSHFSPPDYSIAFLFKSITLCWQQHTEVTEQGQYNAHFLLQCATNNKLVLSLNLAASALLSIWGNQTRGQGVNHYCCWGERGGVARHGINGGQMEFFHNNWWYIFIAGLKSTSSEHISHLVPFWTFFLSISIIKSKSNLQ